MLPNSCHAIIRADACEATGNGHVMRMIALGQALLERGTRVSFMVIQCPEVLHKRLKAERFEVISIYHAEPGDSVDASAVSEYARAILADWIILDGYHFSTDYQKLCKQSGKRVLAVDDHQYNRAWSVDSLLNQNLHAPSHKADYVKAAAKADLLLGTDFVLMRNEFWKPRPKTQQIESASKKLLLTMGGADPVNATALIMHALLRVPLEALHISILIGSGNPHRSLIEQITQQYPGRFELLEPVESVTSLLCATDYVITAGGSTCWEVLWAGLPSAIFVIAENQQDIADSLVEQGLMVGLGRWGQVSSDELTSKLTFWLQNPTVPRQNIVDGKGAKRVAAYLHGHYSITIATAEEGWLRRDLSALKEALEASGHTVNICSKPEEFTGGDFLFLLSYWGVVPTTLLDQYLHAVIVHASDLPNGRGWSPATWHILEGRDALTVCLLEASARVDRGDIYYRDHIPLRGDELIDEWRALIVAKTAELCLRFTQNFPSILARREKQPEVGSYYRRRTPADSQLDTSKALDQLFNQLRVADNVEYPAYFDLHGQRYLLKIEKAST